MSRQTVLIVEDDPDLARLLEFLLEDFGFTPVIATDYEEAVSSAEKHELALVLLDISLPTRDGFAFLDWLRNENPGSAAPVIMLSAHDPELHEQKVIEAGAQAYMQKPIDPVKLLTLIEKSL